MTFDQSVMRLKIATLLWFVATIALGLSAPKLSVVIFGIVALGMIYWAVLMFFVLPADGNGAVTDQVL